MLTRNTASAAAGGAADASSASPVQSRCRLRPAAHRADYPAPFSPRLPNPRVKSRRCSHKRPWRRRRRSKFTGCCVARLHNQVDFSRHGGRRAVPGVAACGLYRRSNPDGRRRLDSLKDRIRLWPRRIDAFPEPERALSVSSPRIISRRVFRKARNNVTRSERDGQGSNGRLGKGYCR